MDHPTVRAGDRGPDPTRFPSPPYSFTDETGRTIDVEICDERDTDALIEMYDALSSDDRAQGVPPSSRARIEAWLTDLLDTGIHVVAWHGDLAVGHACLVPAGDRGHELAIFVASDYHRAGIGTELLQTLLGHGRSRGVERVWLLVRRSNRVARHLYESAGFERVDDPVGGYSSEIEMISSIG